MAINQFLTFVLPRKSIEQKFGQVPEQLEIKHAEWEDYWENLNVDSEELPEPEFEDAISTKWWKGITIDESNLKSEIDKIIPRSNWSDDSWKVENGIIDHDVSIDFNRKEQFIEDFRFRTDLGDSKMIFIKSMLELCQKNDWILMDDKGYLCKPHINEFANLIKGSNAYRFISNPEEFLDSLD